MTETRAENQSVRALPRALPLTSMIAQEAILDGKVDVIELTRLAGALANTEGSVSVHLEFSKDDEKRRCVKGELTAQVNVFCQRCLSPMPLEVTQAFCLAVVADEEAGKQLPETLDPVFVVDDELDVFDLTEEEVLLALPIVSKHPHECGMREYFVSEQSEDEPRQNPFENLADMLDKK